MEIKITKKTKLLEQNNDKAHNFYYLINGKILNDEKTRYRPFKFVLFFDAFEIQEYYEQDYYSKEDLKNFIDELCFSYTQHIKSYDDCKEFFEICNDSINSYNKFNKGW